MGRVKYFEKIIPEVIAWTRKQKTTPWIFLEGDLGAGKTTFTKEFLEKSDYPAADVQSPTFLKVLTYKNVNSEVAIHIDAYRIETTEEFLRLGLENNTNVKVGIVEWPKVFKIFLQKYPQFREVLDIGKVLLIRLPSDHGRGISISEIEV